jgi:hypothetical protein
MVGTSIPDGKARKGISKNNQDLLASCYHCALAFIDLD